MMNMLFTIRTATADDLSGVQACMDAAYAVYITRMKGKPLPPMEADYAEEIRDYPAWVLESDDSVAGALFMMFEAGYTSLANFAVHPRYQGKGFGKALMTFAEQQAKEKGYGELRLATHVLLTENISLYLHIGFEEYDRDDTRVYFRKALS